MSSLPSFQGKLDVLDLIISILQEHEKNLSDIVDRLDAFTEGLSSLEKKITRMDRIWQRRKLPSGNDRRVIVECRKWSDFKDLSVGSSLVAFETADNVLSISSASGEFVFRYSMGLSEADDATHVHHGDSAWCESLGLNPLKVRSWLSEELRVPRDRIVEGRLTTP